MARRYYAVTGQSAEDEVLERMADTGEGEELLSHVVRQAKGSGRKDSFGGGGGGGGAGGMTTSRGERGAAQAR